LYLMPCLSCPRTRKPHFSATRPALDRTLVIDTTPSYASFSTRRQTSSQHSCFTRSSSFVSSMLGSYQYESIKHLQKGELNALTQLHTKYTLNRTQDHPAHGLRSQATYLPPRIRSCPRIAGEGSPERRILPIRQILHVQLRLVILRHSTLFLESITFSVGIDENQAEKINDHNLHHIQWLEA
jgi:hypothetical protein